MEGRNEWNELLRSRRPRREYWNDVDDDADHDVVGDYGDGDDTSLFCEYRTRAEVCRPCLFGVYCSVPL